MREQDRRLIAALRRALDANSPPSNITQEAFDHSRDHLRRLVQLEPDEPAEPGDLWDYTQDLRYTEIQGELFTYLLPVCLQAWQDELPGGRDYGGFVEHFYPVLADRHVFDTHLTPDQTAAASEFIRRSILAEIDDQRGLAYSGMNARPYRWISALTTYGVLLPDVDLLWDAWWSGGTVGRAVSTAQYISALMYPNNNNPVFAPWTPDGGGGPPCLWEFEGNLYSHRWLDPNLDFLRRTLNVSAVIDGLKQAVKELEGKEHEVATRMLSDVPPRSEMLGARCAELPRLLATKQEPSSVLEWSI